VRLRGGYGALSASRNKPGYEMRLSLVVLFLFPLALALGIAIAGKPPRQSLKILAVVIPFQAFGALEAGFTIPPGYLVLFVILVGILARGEFLFFTSPGGKSIAIFLGIAVFATVAAIWGPALPQVAFSESMQYRAGPWRSPVQLALLFFHFSLFFVIVNYAKDRHTADSLLKVHLWMALVLACLGIYQVFAFTFGLPLTDCTWSVNLAESSATIKYSSIRYYSARIANYSVRTTFPESRDFAEYLLSAVPVTVAFCASGSQEIRRRFGFLASPTAAIIGLVAIFFTMSRSGWVFIIIALAIIAIRLSQRRLYLHLLITFVLLSAMSLFLVKVGFFTASTSSLWDIVSRRFDMYYVIHDPRMSYFVILWESFKSHPILGMGAGNFAIWGAAMTGSGLVHSAHGFLWASLADFGLIGLAALLAIFAAIFRRLNRAIKTSPRQSAQRAVMVGLFASLLATLFNSMFGGDRPQFYLLLIMGLAAAYSSLRSTEAAPGNGLTPTRN